MKNRIVGFLVLGVAALMGFMIISFNTALAGIVATACSHGPSCPMWGTIDFQTNVSLAIMAFVVAIGLYLVFFGKEEKVVFKVRKVKEQLGPPKVTRGNYGKAMAGMGADEKKVFENVIEAEGSILQSDLVAGTGLSKVKVTRILDRLEGKGLVERKRRGMTNVVVLRR